MHVLRESRCVDASIIMILPRLVAHGNAANPHQRFQCGPSFNIATPQPDGLTLDDSLVVCL